jgi:hypothetical protein
MPDLRHPDEKREVGDARLAEALSLVLQDDEERAVPEHVEAAVIRAWDVQTNLSVRASRRSAVRRLSFASLVAAAMLAAAVWIQRGARNEGRAAPGGDEPVLYQVDSMATGDLVLDEDPGSLQLVRLRIEASVLAAFGFPVADPADQLVEVEVLIGLDGVPRAIRQADFVRE